MKKTLLALLLSSPFAFGQNYNVQKNGTNQLIGTLTFPNPIVSTVATGTAPLTIASTTLVSNLDAQWLGAVNQTWATPPAIGNTTANTGKFTTLTGTTSITGGTGSFTTLAASSTSALTGNVGIGGASIGTVGLDITSAESGSSAGIIIAPTITATGNSQGMYGEEISPTFATTNGGFTGLVGVGLQIFNPSITGTSGAGAVGLAIQTQSSGTGTNDDLFIGTGGAPAGNNGIYQSDSYANTLAGATTFSGTTNSTSATTGNVIDSGGLGVSGAGFFASGARTSGVVPYFQISQSADTGLTASTTAPGFQTVSATRTWATTGTVADQYEYHLVAPTYASASASQTFTNASTLDISGPPIQGTNASITAPWSLYLETGSALLSNNAYSFPTTPASKTGLELQIGTNSAGQTITMPASDGTGCAVSLFAPTLATTSATQTFGTAATLYVSGAPAAGTNVTITNAYSLDVAAGTSIFNGLATFAAGVTASGATANDFSGSSGAFKTSTGAVTIGTGTTTFTGPAILDGTNATTALTVSQTARTAGVLPYALINIPADTGITAATEGPGFKTATATRTWATTGTVALQRENFWAGPTYASASASQTFTDVFTGYMTPPIAGSNAIFTREHTFGIVDSTSASSSITGGLVVATTLGTAGTSVGIGGGNINAGGTGTFGGNLLATGSVKATGSSAAVGYATGGGAGTAVTQTTSRTTAVTSNTSTGAITLFTTTGSATAATFTVNCTAVASTDVIVWTEASGTNLYEIFTTAISNGVSFNCTFFTTGGTASDTPVFNYTIIKGSSN